MPDDDGAHLRTVCTPSEASDWTETGECRYPQFTFYHFTTTEAATHIRDSGFSEALGTGGFVWLTRDPDDPVAAQNGTTRLIVAVRAKNLLVVLPHETLEDALTSLGWSRDEAQADFICRSGYCGVWDNAADRPWVGIVNPTLCRIVDRHLETGAHHAE